LSFTLDFNHAEGSDKTSEKFKQKFELTLTLNCFVFVAYNLANKKRLSQTEIDSDSSSDSDNALAPV
jgi:hypothetical protein